MDFLTNQIYPFQLIKDEGQLVSMVFQLPIFGIQNISNYDKDEFNNSEFLNKELDKLEICIKTDRFVVKQVEEWQRGVLKNFTFKNLEMNVVCIYKYLFDIFELQSQLKTFKIVIEDTMLESEISNFFKYSANFSQQLKYFSFVQRANNTNPYKHDLSKSILQFIQANINHLKQIDLTYNVNDLIFVIKQLAKSMSNSIQYPLKEVNLFFQPQNTLVSDEEEEKNEEKQINKEEEEWISSLFEKVQKVERLVLSFVSSLNRDWMYEDICKIFVSQERLQQLTINITRSQIQFDAFILLQAISKLNLLSKVHCDFSFSTKIICNSNNEIAQLRQVQEISLGLEYCSCADKILASIGMYNLQSMKINISNNINQEDIRGCLTTVASHLNQNQNQSIQKLNINISYSHHIDSQTQNHLISIIINKLQSISKLKLQGFQPALFSTNIFNALFRIKKCTIHFLEIPMIKKYIYENINTLHITNNIQSETRIDFDFLKCLLDASCRSNIKSFIFNAIIRVQDHNTFLSSNKFVILLSLLMNYPHFERFYLIKKDLDETLGNQAIDLCLKIIEIFPLLRSFETSCRSPTNCISRQQLVQLCQIIAKKYTLDKFQINRQTIELQEITKSRSDEFKVLMISIQLIKQSMIQNIFRKEIIQEILEITSFNLEKKTGCLAILKQLRTNN